MTEVEDTYCEAFDGIFTQLLVTAEDRELLERAATESTALPTVVFGLSEGGIEGFVPPEDTPDGREGASIQIWVDEDPEKLEEEVAKRIRQGTLVTPTTRVFDGLEGEGSIDTMDKVGHCGDGYEWVEERFGRVMIDVPIMFGDFLIEREVSYGEGTMAGNLWFLCDSRDSALEVGDRVMDILGEREGVVTPFDICSAGSKPETSFPEIGPTTNHWFCPSLKGDIPDSKVPEGVESIPEVVINGVSREAVENAMSEVIDGIIGMDGLLKVSAGNYGGELGDEKIYLSDLV